MEEEWPYPLLSKEIDARHRAKKISDGNSCSSLAVLIPRTAGWWVIDPRWKPRQADNRYRRSMHLRMTPWIEAWSQALNDVVHETRAYDHNTYEQYMAWYSSQTRIRLLAPEDPDERGELVRDAKTLWEKLRDGIAGTNQEVMATVDSLRRKAQPERVPPHSSAPITSQWQGGFAAFAGPTQSVPLHAPTYGTNPWKAQSIDYGGTSFGGGVHGYMDLLQQGDWLFGQYSSHRNEIPYMQAPFDNFIDIYIAYGLGLCQGLGPYTASYGDISSFGGGSSLVPNELRASQTDDAPRVTQPTQPEVDDLQGNNNDPHRSNRERHEPNRLSLSGPRHAAGGKKKTTKKPAGISRTMTDHDDE
uniref:Aminotransferase-like plant mobile domain-containing protein n=1 Tax=Oryza rufipogon TaxID=4529 RepID=A0A0E0QQY5_ORYRU